MTRCSVVKINLALTRCSVAVAHDTLVGGGGADVVDGGDGADVFELDGSVGVTAEGGDGL